MPLGSFYGLVFDYLMLLSCLEKSRDFVNLALAVGWFETGARGGFMMLLLPVGLNLCVACP